MSEPDEFALRSIAPHFDRFHYLAANPDVGAAGVDPMAHFLHQGWREGRDPSADFDVRYYLRANPDVAACGINPFLHYVLAGRSEGRLPRRPQHAERGIIERARTPAERAREWQNANVGLPALDRAALGLALDADLPNAPCLVVSISHDDYTCHWGGVQNLIREEAGSFAAMNAIYLHLSPVQPLPMLAPRGNPEELLFRLRLQGRQLGQMRTADLAAALASAARATGTPLLLVVHHLLGSATEALSLLATTSGFPPIVWTHDYFTVCPSVQLLRNDVRFCGAPPVGSTACEVCIYGEERAASRERIQSFFQAHRPFVIAPSETAARVWRRAGLPHRSLDIQPLVRLALHEATPRNTTGRPIRIAHLGARYHAKGWPVFEQLARRFRNDPRYAFFQLGMATLSGSVSDGIRPIPVKVTADAPDAMIEAVARHGIDVVVNWASWPETFCYAALEALAGGAFLLTRADTGNVAAAAEAHPASARVIPTEEALHALLEGEGLAAALAAAPPQRGSLLPQGGTAAWLIRSTEGRAVSRAVLRQQIQALEAA
ncbi:hypothetical protein GXW78_02735 [Roseomonas terrae]|uniref:Glycosyltransferase subfamily 4-like N-terminal domain-containing protein n=1 Tax=Neoroseomonas terrae TaxID=424799 RepID=A0ABS5EC23_9PROT|nr:hypothetical protein [Neoroseomonas terrae]MBR0648566.1 hypothetical protein [Neoroseomonas terrae]